MSHGEIWRRQVGLGLEVTASVPVAASRRAYLQAVDIDDPRPSEEHEYDTGDINRVRVVTLGSAAAGGSASMQMSPDELLEWLLIGFQGGVTPTTPAGATLNRLWTFVPSTTNDSATLEFDNAAGTFKLAGTQVDQFTFAANVTGPATVAMTLFGTGVTPLGAFASVAQRQIRFVQGYQMRFYVDALGTATWGTTVAPTELPGTLMNYQVQVNFNRSRLYTADNTLNANAVIRGGIKVSATYTIKAASAATAAQLAAYTAETERLVRVKHIGPVSETGMDVGTSREVDVDAAGKWTGRRLSGTDQGVAVYEFSLTGNYDVTNAFTARVRCLNARTAAFA